MGLLYEGLAQLLFQIGQTTAKPQFCQFRADTEGFHSSNKNKGKKPQECLKNSRNIIAHFHSMLFHGHRAFHIPHHWTSPIISGALPYKIQIQAIIDMVTFKNEPNIFLTQTLHPSDKQQNGENLAYQLIYMFQLVSLICKQMKQIKFTDWIIFNKINRDMSNQEAQRYLSTANNSKADRLKQIDDLYQTQIKQIYKESKQQVKEKQLEIKKEKSPPAYISTIKKVSSNTILKDQFNKQQDRFPSKIYRSPETESRIRPSMNSPPIQKRIQQDKTRASVFLQGESTRTIQILRRQNQIKEMKIRELSSKCESLVQRLKGYLSQTDLQKQMESLKQFSDTKMQRLQNLFKIKNEEIFFKMKLQIIGLLQEFQVSKQDINGINEVNNQSALYSFMVRKLKLKLKDFRSKEQQSNFEIQKDKILNQKYEERIHYLMETNQLLKLSETKLKNKIEDLRGQMNQFLEKLKGKEKEIQDRESQIFRLKKQNEELQATNQKINHVQRNISSQRSDEKKIYEAKEKQMKALLSSYFLERKKLEGTLEEKEGQIEQILIRQKFLQQENERINRQYVRWKERYEWLEKEKENRQREYQQEKAQLVTEFMEYKNENNQGVYMACKAETDEAIRKVEQYQTAYQKIILELEQQRRNRLMKEEESQSSLQRFQKQWAEKVKRIEKLKEQEMYELASDHENRQKQIRQQYQRRQELLAEQMQARMKALLAENDKKATERMIEVQNENDELRKQIESLSKIIEVKQSLISVMNTRKQQSDL